MIALRRRLASEHAVLRANHWFEQAGVAIVSLAHGFVTLCNQAAKDMYPNQGEILTYDAFQTPFRMPKKIYPDDFIYHKIPRLTMIDPSQKLHQYRVETYLESDVAYLYIAMVPHEVEPAIVSNPNSSRNGVERMLQNLKGLSTPLTIGWLRGSAILGEHKYSFQRLAAMTAIIRFAFEQAAGERCLDFDTVDHGDWLFALDTIDKRVIHRIAKQTMEIIRDRFQNELSIVWDESIAFVAIALTKERPLETILDALDMASFEPASESPVTIVERSLLERIERSNALHVRLEEMLKSDRLELRYVPMSNVKRSRSRFGLQNRTTPSTKTIRCFKRPSNVLIWKSNLIKRCGGKQSASSNSFIAKPNATSGLPYCLSAKSLSRPASGRLLVLEAKRRKLPLDHLTHIR
ncbi:MAG: hypothetical protein MZU97_04165 [Bacillus subtilis]|nr:hypothetical protein [Bacillus subtilis]